MYMEGRRERHRITTRGILRTAMSASLAAANTSAPVESTTIGTSIRMEVSLAPGTYMTAMAIQPHTHMPMAATTGRVVLVAQINPLQRGPNAKPMPSVREIAIRLKV